MNKLEAEAREFARVWCKANGKNSRHVRIKFAADFAELREREIKALHRELAKFASRLHQYRSRDAENLIHHVEVRDRQLSELLAKVAELEAKR